MRIKLLVLFFVLLNTASAFADGFIVIPEPNRQIATAYPLDVRYHFVDVAIDALSAVTSVEQEFVNPTAFTLEGLYIFPVPQGSVIRKFSMMIDGKETEAELLDADKARAVYEDIVRKQRDPALLEYSGRQLFKLRIYPVEPHGRKIIKLTYTETLSKENGSIEYLYGLNTEKFSPKNPEKVRVKVSIRQDAAVRNVYSPTHPVVVARDDDGRTTVLYEEENVKPDADFKLYIDTSSSGPGSVFRAFRQQGDDGFFFINASVPADALSSETPKDIVFLLDVSGSMAGEKLEQAKSALTFCVDNLNKGDRFQIIRFSTEAEGLFDTLSRADDARRLAARAFIHTLKAIGGTALEDAVKMALEYKKDPSRPFIVVLITDGKPTIGETGEDLLVDQIRRNAGSNVRFFTVGLGFDVNTHLLDRIASLTRGYTTYLSPHEDLERAVSALYTKIRFPAMTEISAVFKGVKTSKCTPKDLPDLFAGSSLSIFGRYEGKGAGELVLEGKVRGKIRRYIYPLEFPSENASNDFIPPVWATRRVGFLLDQIRLRGENKELVDEVVSLSRAYGVISPYTSYLILEDEARRSGRGDIRPDDVTLGNTIPVSPPVMKEYQRQMNEMKSSSGEGSVRGSTQLRSMYDAENMSAVRQTQKDDAGRTAVVTAKTRSVQGRAMYNTSKGWIDPRLQTRQNDPVKKIRFASDEYFALAKQDPMIAKYLSVGKLVRFVFGNTSYEITE